LKPLDLITVKLSWNLPTGLLLSFCDDLNLHISVGLFKLRVPTKVTNKRISQANYFYRTSISRTTTHQAPREGGAAGPPSRGPQESRVDIPYFCDWKPGCLKRTNLIR